MIDRLSLPRSAVVEQNYFDIEPHIDAIKLNYGELIDENPARSRGPNFSRCWSGSSLLPFIRVPC